MEKYNVKEHIINVYWCDRISELKMYLGSLESSLTRQLASNIKLDLPPAYKTALKEIISLEKKLKDIKVTIREQIKKVNDR